MLNDNIRTVRKNKGFTQEDLASRIHVTRQTISKWEKGISVPDAEMLTRLAEELETDISTLLGAKVESAADENAIVEQLSRLNEQLAIRNRRSRKVWKTLAIIGIAIIVIPLILSVLGMTLFAVRDHGVQTQAGSVHYQYQEGDYSYNIDVNYDNRYNVVAFGVDSPGPDEDATENGEFSTDTYTFINSLSDITDARKLDKKLKEYAEAHGGTVIVISEDGIGLPGND
ncbi:MAG: helix-turn-helix transcriptional regulator [Mogibacterium sp.]|nr:helix-turn-helix transcriptional regulator [Mogibacterium sp.]